VVKARARPHHPKIYRREEAKVPILWSSDEQLLHKSTKVPPEKARKKKKRRLVALMLKSAVVINTRLSKKKKKRWCTARTPSKTIIQKNPL